MRTSAWGLFSVLLVATFIGLACAEGDDVAEGKELFMNRCKMCHGDDGTGNAAMARILKVEFKAMDADYVQEKSDEEFKQIITQGKGKMAAVRGLKPAQIDAIIAYVRSLKKEE